MNNKTDLFSSVLLIVCGLLGLMNLYINSHDKPTITSNCVVESK